MGVSCDFFLETFSTLLILIRSIIFVHGLNGHPRKSWASEKTGFYWPLEVSKKISDARLMTFGYIADFATGNHNHMGIRQHAESLLLNLNNIRLLAMKNRPLVFVCHSLGGLVTKEALSLDSRKGLGNQVIRLLEYICCYRLSQGSCISRSSQDIVPSFSEFMEID